jgi:hypothetical protein
VQFVNDNMESKGRRDKWRVQMRYLDPVEGRAVEKVVLYPTHRGAMSALRRQLLVFWRGKPAVEVYRIGVNSVRAPLWGVMSFEAGEGKLGQLPIANGQFPMGGIAGRGDGKMRR